MTDETDDKIMSHIETECNKFIDHCEEIKLHHTGTRDIPFFLCEALKAGFYGGFKAGVLAVRDINEII